MSDIWTQNMIYEEHNREVREQRATIEEQKATIERFRAFKRSYDQSVRCNELPIGMCPEADDEFMAALKAITDADMGDDE